MPAASGSFIWYELMTDDLEGARAFYKAVIGWNTENWGPPGAPPYVIVKAGESGVGGLMTMPDHFRAGGGKPGWFGYIYVPDVDAAVTGLSKAGGTVHRPAWDIPEIGRLAVVADPQGAVFMLMAPIGPDQPQPPLGTPGTIGWRELYAADWPSAFDFYEDQFGWTKTRAIDMGPMGTYQLFSTGGDGDTGGVMDKPPTVPMPVWVYYFNVEAIDAAIGRVTTSGGTLLMPAMEVPGGSWVAQCTDPQGAWFALVAPRR